MERLADAGISEGRYRGLLVDGLGFDTNLKSPLGYADAPDIVYPRGNLTIWQILLLRRLIMSRPISKAYYCRSPLKLADNIWHLKKDQPSSTPSGSALDMCFKITGPVEAGCLR